MLHNQRMNKRTLCIGFIMVGQLRTNAKSTRWDNALKSDGQGFDLLGESMKGEYILVPSLISLLFSFPFLVISCFSCVKRQKIYMEQLAVLEPGGKGMPGPFLLPSLVSAFIKS